MADTNNPTSITPDQAAVAKKVAKAMPDARIFEPKDKGNYYGPVVFADKKHVAQQVGEQTVVVHSRADMKLSGEGDKAPSFKKGEVVSVQWAHAEDVGRSVPTIEAADPERWKERAARTPASEQHTKLARDVLGERFGVYNAPSAEAALSPRYEGVIAATTDSHLIQRVNSRTAIVHAVGPELAQQYAAGQEVAVSYDNGKVREVAEVQRTREQKVERPTPAREQGPTRDDDDKAKARSFVLARNLVRQSHGPDAKLYNASRVDDQAGKFRGPLVSVTDHHAVQRVGNDGKFIVHDRASLEGEVRTGRFVQIDYDKGRAQVKEAQTRRQQREQTQSRAPARPAEDRSRGQGLSR